MHPRPVVEPPRPRHPTPSERFAAVYAHLNGTVYAGALPPFPGVELVDRADIFSMTRTFGKGPWRELRPFLLSKHVKGALLEEAIRHEVAHAAALLWHDDEGHGPAWQHHAKRCGASGEVELDEGHPLREGWPAT